MTSAKPWEEDSILSCQENLSIKRALPEITAPLEVGIELIDANPYQTRRKFVKKRSPNWLIPLRPQALSSRLCLRPGANGRYQLVAGERRWMASKRAGKTTIPAVVRQISNEQAMEITIIENLQREDLNPMEQARAFERLSREFGLTQEQIATRTGKDRASIANFIRLLKLPVQSRTALKSARSPLATEKF